MRARLKVSSGLCCALILLGLFLIIWRTSGIVGSSSSSAFPTVVADTDFNYSLGTKGNQIFFHDGYWFVFYFNGSDVTCTDGVILYKSSSDGGNWSDPQIAAEDANISVYFSLYQFNDTVVVAYTSMQAFSSDSFFDCVVRTRMGTISSRNIAWETAIVLLSGPEVGGRICSYWGDYAFDKHWLTIEYLYGGYEYRCAIFSTSDFVAWDLSKDWINASGGYVSQVTLRFVENNRLMALYGSYIGSEFNYMFYNGSDWSDEYVTSGSGLKSGLYKAQSEVVINGTMYILYSHWDYITSLKLGVYNGSWYFSDFLPEDRYWGGDSSVTFDRTTNTTYFFYIDAETNQVLAAYTTDFVNWVKNLRVDAANSEYIRRTRTSKFCDGSPAVAWIAGSEAPFHIKFALFAPASAQGDSVVQNGGFEQGLTGWTHSGDGFLAPSSDNPHSGNYSLEISSSVIQQAYCYQYIDFPNASYAFSFWVFRVDPISWTVCYLGRDWDGNTIRAVSTLVIMNDQIELNAWDNPYAPGRQVFNYDVAVGVWHNVTFLANATLGTQGFYIDGNFIENLNSSSGNVFSPNLLMFGDVNTVACHGTFYFDDIELNALETANTSNPTPVLRVQPENVTVKKGEVFTVSVVLENIPENPGAAGIQFTVNWNQTVLSALNMTEVLFHEITPISEWDNIWLLAHKINNTRGFVEYAYLWQDFSRARNGGYAPVWGNHTLATITFVAIETGSTTLHFSNMIVGTSDAEVLICSHDRSNTPLLPSLITDGKVDVSATEVRARTDPVTDINGDGSVDLFDALLLAQHYGSTQAGPNWDPNMDLNGDAQVDIYDFIILAHNYGTHV